MRSCRNKTTEPPPPTTTAATKRAGDEAQRRMLAHHAGWIGPSAVEEEAAQMAPEDLFPFTVGWEVVSHSGPST